MRESWLEFKINCPTAEVEGKLKIEDELIGQFKEETTNSNATPLKAPEG